MATLNIGGRRVKVDDSFLSLPPDQQQATVDEIAGSIGAMPQASSDRDEPSIAPPTEGAAGEFARAASAMTQNPAKAAYDALPEWQKPIVAASDVVSRSADGLMFGFGDEIAAGIRAPISGRSYTEELAEQERLTNAEKRRAGGAGTVAELAGGLRTALGMAGRGYSMGTNAAVRGEGLNRIAMGTLADGLIVGGLTGAGAPGDFETRAKNTLIGAGVGGATGLATPYVTKAITAAAEPIIAPVMARLRPQTYANKAIGGTLDRAGMTADDVALQLQRAADDGQDMFNVADALGHAGRRDLSTVVRTPNNMRQTAVDTLTGRQMGQGERLSNALAEGFAAPDTAAQRVAMLTSARNEAADVAYELARKGAGAVDVSDAIKVADDIVSPGVNKIATPASNIADDSLESVVGRVRAKLTDGRSNLTDFNSVLRVKQDISDMIETAKRAGKGNQARVLTQINKKLDGALEKASAGYRAANDAFRRQSLAIDAIDAGKTAASGRMRAADTIPAFNRASPEQQAAFRAGYVDPYIARVESMASSPTTNKARILQTGKTSQEFPAFAAPGKGDQLQSRIAREQRMFETANAALGGSKTADNLADAAEMAKFDPAVMTNLLRGRPVQAIIDAVTRVMNEAKGMPPAVIDQVAKVLLETSPEAAKKLLAAGADKRAKDGAMRALANAILANYGTLQGGRLARP